MKTLTVERSGDSSTIVEILFPYNTKKYSRFYISSDSSTIETTVSFPAFVSFRTYKSLPPRLVSREIQPLKKENVFQYAKISTSIEYNEEENEDIIKQFILSNYELQKYTLSEFEYIDTLKPLVPVLAKKHPVCWVVKIGESEVFFPYWTIAIRNSRASDFFAESFSEMCETARSVNSVSGVCKFVSSMLNRHYFYETDSDFAKAKDYVGSDDKYAVGDCEDFASAGMRMIKTWACQNDRIGKMLKKCTVSMLCGQTPWGFHMWCCVCEEPSGNKHFVDGTNVSEYLYITHEYSSFGNSLLLTDGCYGVTTEDFLSGNYKIKHFSLSDTVKELAEYTIGLDLEPLDPFVVCT